MAHPHPTLLTSGLVDSSCEDTVDQRKGAHKLEEEHLRECALSHTPLRWHAADAHRSARHGRVITWKG
jgi:hypothetical protein